MACTGCAVGAKGEAPSGCGSKGSCSNGGCNRLNTFDWLSKMDIQDAEQYPIVEVSFKNGAKKQFFRLPPYAVIVTGDPVVVDTGNGYDIGHVSLSGDLVRLQMKKKRVEEETVVLQILRQANDRDLEKLQQARELEHATMVRARVIARMLDLDMKIGDVEYQADRRKATFYYTADGRVDFRELIRHYAKEFRIKIEMRQIGARQESARIGGLGSCGRELCCSTWLTDFKSVSTTAARYQNLAINQAKLSGQCGRLKCCLNYELDSYVDALTHFPKNAERLKTEKGTASLVKTDIFKGLMYFAYDEPALRGRFYPLHIDKVKQIKADEKKGNKPISLEFLELKTEPTLEEAADFENVHNVIDLPFEKRSSKRRKKRSKRHKSDKGTAQRPKATQRPSKAKPKSQSTNQKNSKKTTTNSGGEKPKSSNYKKRSKRNYNKKKD